MIYVVVGQYCCIVLHRAPTRWGIFLLPTGANFRGVDQDEYNEQNEYAQER